MAIHWIFCVVCGGPPNDPYDDIVTGRVAEAGATPEQLKAEYFEQWLGKVELFGMQSALPVYDDSDDDDTQTELATAKRNVDATPEFFPDVWVGCGYNIAFHPPGYGIVPVLEPDGNGHSFFPMHSACATIVQTVCASDTTTMSLQYYYHILRKACLRFPGEGGILWPHKHFGAMQYWAYDDWNYTYGYLKFVTDPLRSEDAENLILTSLKPAEAKTSRPRNPELEHNCSAIGNLPKEIIDEVAAFLPIDAIFSLRLTSPTLAHQVSLDQRFFRERLLSGELLPHIWGLDWVSCQKLIPNIKKRTMDSSEDNYWDWKRVARLLADVPRLMAHSPEREEIPLGLWNRCRIWQSVVDAEKWLNNG
ncbi:hypothetical protein E8E12_002265 [Didymella heteroderae]|uniref:F-box domain-containing protein n=1 Tax=Didymella heteroderae TaxID=1769908 RepID=A0A9P5C1Y3_9PLEO|nr:hypothetical protein E8E12_002265 [Didymella heteroderae]